MECVVAWFWECGSSVRMSFCAAHFSVTAFVEILKTTNAAKRSFLTQSPWSFCGKRILHQRGEIAGAQRNHLVVEIVAGVVQKAVVRTAALAEEYIRARPLEQHVGKILAAHHRRVVGDDVVLAEHPLADPRGELRFAGAVDGA